MESAIKGATPRETAILNKYVNKSATLHISLTVGLYAASINIVLGPSFLTQDLPIYDVYPFDVEPHPIFELVYFHHAFTAIQTAVGTSTYCFVALLLWFAGARFEMLEMEIGRVVDEYDLERCILKHAHILSYAERVADVVSVVICVSVCFTTILMVFSGILFLFTDSETVRAQFIMVDLVSIVQMFVSSYAAENLIQKYLSTAFSYFTTFRAVLQQNV